MFQSVRKLKTTKNKSLQEQKNAFIIYLTFDPPIGMRGSIAIRVPGGVAWGFSRRIPGVVAAVVSGSSRFRPFLGPALLVCNRVKQKGFPIRY